MIIVRNRSGLWLILVVAAASACGCVSQRERSQAGAPARAPRIESLTPSSTAAGVSFMRQPSGASAVIVSGGNFIAGARVYYGASALDTTFASTAGLTAIVPAEIYEKPGRISVTVHNPDGQVSSAVTFEVYPFTGSAPILVSLQPAESIAGKAFNVQPNGDSALILKGKNFRPGIVAVFDGVVLDTTFADSSGGTAIVPSKLIHNPKTVPVQVKNPDGAISNVVSFAIRGAL